MKKDLKKNVKKAPSEDRSDYFSYTDENVGVGVTWTMPDGTVVVLGKKKS